MIARCPECETRYRVAREQIGPRGARIRCSRCSVVFRVQAPREEPPVEIEPLPDDEPVSAREPVASSEPVAPPPPPPEPKPPLHHALVVEADGDMAKQLAELLKSWRIDVSVLADGGEGLLHLHRRRPDFAILGGHLPGLSAPTIAEIVRRTRELKGMILFRVAPLEEPGGAPEFEANETIEPGDLPDGIERFLESNGLGERPAPEPPPAAAPRQPAPTPRPLQRAPSDALELSDPEPSTRPVLEDSLPKPRAAARPAPSSDPEVAAAERLARIVISDIILYNEDKFRQGVADGNVAAALEAEIEEASAMFRSRVKEEIRAQRDFLADELLRRAAT